MRTKELLPAVPIKKIFDINEVVDLCDVKPHIIRYWEREFIRTKFGERVKNRRYYKHSEVMLLRKIRYLLYEKGLTINGVHSILNNFKDLDFFNSNDFINFKGNDLIKIREKLQSTINLFNKVLNRNC
ncbi:putative transcriptional regulator [Candidatus Kinetoplastibacterium desouzaii TCC079E]|uniref:Putative transcriptional regulator n=1 Tax=Candidatus Kinetoplastidibacterium desouzai TCC079E TaxID=1208919 RepID=M1LMA4_9PROT|nr:MerR family transcriptional regulator [Candidatus Kinetoplastibacterium desouzaii]AGF46852.1 putative transcriptional regulator [Candidatus Kinetoplastibacterium desouzaii TCC079E]